MQIKPICTVHLVEDRTLCQEEASEIIYQFKVQKQHVSEVGIETLNEFIIQGDQVQMKRPVQYLDNPKLTPETKKELDDIVKDYSDISERTSMMLVF